jgi:hypothetical protein
MYQSGVMSTDLEQTRRAKSPFKNHVEADGAAITAIAA